MYRKGNNDMEAYENYYASLKGATITNVTHATEDHDVWTTLHITLADGNKVACEISRDEEGNGPGFMFGLTFPPDLSPSEPSPLQDRYDIYVANTDDTHPKSFDEWLNS